MSEKHDIIDLATSIVGLHRTGEVYEIESRPPPQRIDDLTVGAPPMTRVPPHGGETHSDGDELLFLISGEITVVLEDQEPPRRVGLVPGQALIVPRGIWHRILLRKPSQVLHVTPGPGSEPRPLSAPDSSAAAGSA